MLKIDDKKGDIAVKKNVILSFASTYGYYELQPFVESWKENLSEIDLYIFYLDFSELTKRWLNSVGVNIVEAPSEYKDEFFNKNGNVMLIRMRLFNAFLKEHIHEYKSVLISDCRDVFFQGNPFLDMDIDMPQEGRIKFSSEGISIVDSGGNPYWLTRFVGNEDWKEQFGNREVLNGGVYCGTANEIIRYHQLLIDMMPGDQFWGVDQAAMNYVVYNVLSEKMDIIYSDPNTGDLISIFNNRSACKLENDYVVNKDGNVPSVVHQYDRVPSLVDFVNARYRNNVMRVSLRNIDFRSNLEMIKMCFFRGDYQNALGCSFVLDARSVVLCHTSIIISLIKDILYKCDLLKDNRVAPFVWQLVWKQAVNIFSNMAYEEKVAYLNVYLELVNESQYLTQTDADLFQKHLWGVLQYYVNEKNWLEARKLIDKEGWRIKDVGSDFYLIASHIYRNLNLPDESIGFYTIGCNLKCKSIYYMRTYFKSYVLINGNKLSHIGTGKPENVMSYHPVYFMKHSDGGVLIVCCQMRFLYIQSFSNDGDVSLSDEPKVFKFSVISNDVVSVMVDENDFLSARLNGKMGLAGWSKPWEHFSLIPCNEPKLYSIMGR